jgi:Ca-activated chloride channel family protein
MSGLLNNLELFHFLRPLWLLAIPVIALVWWLTRRRKAETASATKLIAAHLREALTINKDGQDLIEPIDLILALGILLALAAAGPTWSKQPSPWFAETAPLVVALKVADTMRANDVQPTRLERARFKLLDLIAARTGSRTAVIAYADSAHIVVPPSKDIDVIKPLLESLDPAIMPAQGSNTADVLPLARELLGEDAAFGTILFVNDGFDPLDIEALANFAAEPDAPAMAALIAGTAAGGVAFLPDGSPVTGANGSRLDTRVDESTLEQVRRAAGMPIVRLGPGNQDIRSLLRAIESNLQQAEDANAQWLDQGWLLLWPAALLMLYWFRRGWTTQW